MGAPKQGHPRNRKRRTNNMLVYQDIHTGEEMLSDSFPFEMLHDGEIIKVPAKYITVGGEDFQLEGANASAEGEDADEGGEAAGEQVIDLINAFKLEECWFEKREYTAYIKVFMKKCVQNLKAKNPDRVPHFKEHIQPAIKEILGKFDNFRFFITESQNQEGNVALLDFDDEGKPFFWFITAGMDAVKF